LLDQKQGYEVDKALQEARKYEAMVAGRETLQSLRSPQHTAIDEIKQRRVCQNCALSHAQHTKTSADTAMLLDTGPSVVVRRKGTVGIKRMIDRRLMFGTIVITIT